jgi:hypothetical protein
MFRPNHRAIIRQIFKLVECTIYNAFNLRDLVLQELVEIILVCYIKDLRLKFKCGIYTGTDTCNYKLLLIECHYFYSKLIMTVLKTLRLSKKTALPYKGRPKNNRNLNVARELEVVARCAARYQESRQYSSSLSLGVSLGWMLLLLWLFFLSAC